MKEIVRFFYERWKRATQMDATNKHLGNHTHYWIQAEEWITAYKQTLSKSKLQEFDKEWNKLDKELEDWKKLPDKKQLKAKTPLL